MSRMEGNGHNSSTNYYSRKRIPRPSSLLAFIEDPSRTDPILGLRYVTELKISGTDKSIVRCNLCHVKGHIKSMVEHLVGNHHIKAYMEIHYSNELQSLKLSDNNKALIKDFAKEIERAEGTKNVQIEYISPSDLKSIEDNWRNEEDGPSKSANSDAVFLDRRRLALKYSETFKITSRAEASMVLQLTEQLSNNLEQYFLHCKGLDALDTGIAASRPEPPTNIVSSTVYGNLDSSGSVGLESTSGKPGLMLEEPMTSSMSYIADAQSFDRFHVPLPAGSEAEMRSESFPSHQAAFLESSSVSDSPSIKRMKMEDPDPIPFMSSSTIPNRYVTLQSTSMEASSSQPTSSAASYRTEYTDHSATAAKHSDPDGHKYGTFKVEQSSKHKTSVAHVSMKTPTDSDANFEVEHTKLSRSPEMKAQSSIDMDNEEAYLYDDSEPHSSNSDEPQSSSQSQGKTSKALSPDILQLLKGKDANTVTNILKTISPFYPALQDVNIEMLAQVLVNTGALD